MTFANYWHHRPHSTENQLPVTRHNTPSPLPRNISDPNPPALISEADQPHQPLIQTASLPVVLWNQPWVTPAFPEDQAIPLADLRSTAFKEATEGSNTEKFELRGSDVREFTKAFSNALSKAVEHGDFTTILLPQREFVM